MASRRDERLRTVFEAHRGALSAYLSRLGVPADERDDAHQEVLVIAASKLDAVLPGSERAFLFATAQRVASNARRGLRRRLRKADRLSYVEADPLPTIEDLIDQLHARALLDDAMDETPGASRLVFLLHELNGLPLGEIARRLGLPAGTVASRVRRARASLDQWVARKKEGSGVASVRTRAVERFPSGSERGDPEILSWWVSGGETDALRALVGVFERSHPNASVVSAAVSGTTSARQQLVARMSRGTPPDTFQVNGGIDLLRWVRRGSRDRMEPLDFLFSSERWRSAFPRDVLELVTHAGRTYAVPLNIHRTNALFYCKRTFKEHGLSPPTTLAEFYEVADLLRGRGVVPLAMGAKQPWTITMLAFESVMVAVAGGEYYRDFCSGRRSLADPELRAVLGHVSRILDYANADVAELEWDGAVELLRTGRAAMTIMGDWAKGYLAAKGWRVGRDFGEIASPGARGTFVFAVDAFGLPKRGSHRAGAIELLKVFGSKEGQNAFNPIKGSIPARSDVDLSRYDALARTTAGDFVAGRRYPSLPSLAPSSFTRVLDGAMADFARKRDPDRVIDAMRGHYDLLAG